MDEDKKRTPELASWWQDHTTYNWWDSEALNEHLPEVEQRAPRNSQRLITQDWKIECMTPRTVARLLNSKSTPNHYSTDTIASLSLLFDDEKESDYVWDIGNQPMSIGFEVSFSCHHTPDDLEQTKIVAKHYQRINEVAEWLETDPHVDGKRISEHRACSVNKRYEAQHHHDAALLARRIKDRAFTRKEGNTLLDLLKAGAIADLKSKNNQSEGIMRVEMNRRDGVEDNTRSEQRTLTCEATTYWDNNNETAYRACFYWGRNTNAVPTARKSVLASLQELYSWDKYYKQLQNEAVKNA